jgi:hypothetical protein
MISLWAYNPKNRDDFGDDVGSSRLELENIADEQWNAENFSWYSDHNRDLVSSQNGNEKSAHPDVGARLLDAIVVGRVNVAFDTANPSDLTRSRPPEPRFRSCSTILRQPTLIDFLLPSELPPTPKNPRSPKSQSSTSRLDITQRGNSNTPYPRVDESDLTTKLKELMCGSSILPRMPDGDREIK